VSYSSLKFGGAQRHGYILCWSLKNPRYPQTIIKTPAGVTAIDFSASHPQLIAAGMYDGAIAVYDVRKRNPKPILDTGGLAGKHSDPVFQVTWIDADSERGESLVSISTDGKVVLWNMAKGFEHTDLMKLRRLTSNRGTKATAKLTPLFPTSSTIPSAPALAAPAPKGRPSATPTPASSVLAPAPAAGSALHTDAFISRVASGTSFDFQTHKGADHNIYLVGTEDGTIHKCSRSYPEYLENYLGHSGPVYRLRWSPFCAEYFLSCSADWTARLWHSEHEESPMFVFQTFKDYVADIAWSPVNAAVFATCCGDGRLDIWDLSASPVDPIVSVVPERGAECAFGAMGFTPDGTVLFAGDAQGAVHVYKVAHIADTAARGGEPLRTAVMTERGALRGKAPDDRRRMDGAGTPERAEGRPAASSPM